MIKVKAPSSKSITQRALICCSLSKGNSIIEEPLFSEDTELLINALKLLGIKIFKKGNKVEITGNSTVFTVTGKKEIFMGNNGTGFRFLIPICCFYPDEVILTGNERMKKRPVDELVNSLKSSDFEIDYLEKEGFPPVICKKGNRNAKKIKISPKNSSQSVSAILLSSPFFKKGCEVEVLSGIPSSFYVDLTINVMKNFGINILKDENKLKIPENSEYSCKVFKIEGDFSSASYFLVSPFFSNKAVTVENLNYFNSSQPDKYFIDILRSMGANLELKKDSISVYPSKLFPIEIDMNKFPDLVPTLAVLCSIVDGISLIKNISHLKVKESNRIYAIYKNLKKMKIEVEYGEDYLKIYGNPKIIKNKSDFLNIETFNDHRIAMSFSLFLLSGLNLEFDNPDCVKKSFPDFWESLKKFK